MVGGDHHRIVPGERLGREVDRGEAKPGYDPLLGDRARGGEPRDGLNPPQVSIDGTRGSELATALGTVVAFRRNGIDYTVLGSVSAATAEAAARGL